MVVLVLFRAGSSAVQAGVGSVGSGQQARLSGVQRRTRGHRASDCRPIQGLALSLECTDVTEE